MHVTEHIGLYLLYLLEQGIPAKECEEMVYQYAPAILLPDAIRAIVPDIDGMGPLFRGFSHFEEGIEPGSYNAMEFPIGEELKNATSDLIREKCHLVPTPAKSCVNDRTVLEGFIRYNPNLFLPENRIWRGGILDHLAQDQVSDWFFQKRRAKFSSKEHPGDRRFPKDSCQYTFNEQEVMPADFRKDMAKYNNDAIVFMGLQLELRGVDFNQSWIDRFVKTPIMKAYPELMWKTTCEYLTMTEKMDQILRGKAHFLFEKNYLVPDGCFHEETIEYHQIAIKRMSIIHEFMS